jgi:REP element-mobilizing transposase RayT
MTLYRGKYRVQSTRKKGWDYTLPGMYFVTICTEARRPFFGFVLGEAMHASGAGMIAENYWKEIPAHHNNIELDEFIVMPNHVHGIIVIPGERLPELRPKEKFRRVAELSQARAKKDSVSSVLASYKSAVTTWCRAQGLDFAWQPRFHDRIIRGKNSLQAVREYIRDNPKNWHKDPEFIS